MALPSMQTDTDPHVGVGVKVDWALVEERARRTTRKILRIMAALMRQVMEKWTKRMDIDGKRKTENRKKKKLKMCDIRGRSACLLGVRRQHSAVSSPSPQKTQKQAATWQTGK